MQAQRISEAEVSLRLAIYLVVSGRAQTDVAIALDGAQVKIGATQHFDVSGFLASLGWLHEQPSQRWQGKYRNNAHPYALVVHSQPGVGDVTTTLRSGEPFVAEAKKGTLSRSESSSEYKLIHEALGQLLTTEHVPENAVLAIAVPHGERFVLLAQRWREAPLIRRSNIKLLTVAQSGEVFGW